MEKGKAQPHIAGSITKFYKYGWYYHFRHGVAVPLHQSYHLLVSAASIGSRKEKLSFRNAINDVMKQIVNINYQIDFRACKADPCLQIADYCVWAIQRKWERNDTRSYDLIKDKIDYEYELWKNGTTHYY